MSDSFKKVEKIDPFNDAALGEWKPDKKNTNKLFIAFSRTAEISIPEMYKQSWKDPITFKDKLIWGKAVLTERKLISKQNSVESLQREMNPSLRGSHVEDVIPMN
jgi:hypothetical protein